MKLAIATQHLTRIGGVETYLSDIIPALRQAGHEVAVLSAGGAGEGKDTIFQAPPDFPVWVAGEMGAAGAVDALRAWRPDVVYAHGMEDPALEAAVLSVAPSVFFMHVYHGTCISGAKRFARPVMQPCSRTFGPACLLHYYPRRCGGLNPMTMVNLYLKQRKRLVMLRRCDAVVTHSQHMAEESINHGISPERVHVLHFNVSGGCEGAQTDAREITTGSHVRGSALELPTDGPVRVLFVGRLDRNKGADYLIQAAPILSAEIHRDVVVTIAGDGPDRERIAGLLASANAANGACSRIELVGWKARNEVKTLLAKHDLLAFPSVWPEPLGLAGLEAGEAGLPVAAFDVGGVRTWLHDGVNGALARADPPTAPGLAGAMARCVGDAVEYQVLSGGALELTYQRAQVSHVQALIDLFQQVKASTPAACANARPM